MPKNAPKDSPLTFDLPAELLKELQQLVRQQQLPSVSYLVRQAIAAYDFNQYAADGIGHQQLSVRLSEQSRRKLTTLSRKKGVSLGVLLRAALEAVLRDPSTVSSTQAQGIIMAVKKNAKKKAAVKKKAAAKKAVAKKAAKKATKKVVKKAVKKAAAKKATKKAVKKAAKKAPAEKAVKKAAKKAATKKAAAKKKKK